MADLRVDGVKRHVYVATTAPTTATDPSDAAYSRVGQRTNVGLQGTKESTEARDDSGTVTIGGSTNFTNSLTVNYNPTQDAGALILRNAFLADPEPTLFVLETDGEAGHENVVYQTTVTAYGEAQQVGSIAQQTFGLTVQNTPVWALNA